MSNITQRHLQNMDVVYCRKGISGCSDIGTLSVPGLKASMLKNRIIYQNKTFMKKITIIENKMFSCQELHWLRPPGGFWKRDKVVSLL